MRQVQRYLVGTPYAPSIRTNPCNPCKSNCPRKPTPYPTTQGEKNVKHNAHSPPNPHTHHRTIHIAPLSPCHPACTPAQIKNIHTDTWYTTASSLPTHPSPPPTHTQQKTPNPTNTTNPTPQPPKKIDSPPANPPPASMHPFMTDRAEFHSKRSDFPKGVCSVKWRAVWVWLFGHGYGFAEGLGRVGWWMCGWDMDARWG